MPHVTEIEDWRPNDEAVTQKAFLAAYEPLIERVPDDYKKVAVGLLEAVLASSMTNIQSILESHERNRAWKAVQNSQIVGFVNCWNTEKYIAYVDNIFVSPACRRQGVATLLMDTAEDWARGWDARHMTLQSNGALREAHAMYLKRGYVLKGTTELKLRPEMTMLQFSKQLA